ncbi:DUF3197 domain-containing protein [Deinococcus navajonensis]|uniref:DUF3197 domain-containing protein n=1 Tax=Deinococcus navajonensis TaxID=309884 RepID=A0ABV8XLC0_9DEIO
MPQLDPLGVPGAPVDTLNAAMSRAQTLSWAGGRLLLVTDWQGRRPQARYGAVLMPAAGRGEPLVLAAAFGPRFGPAGSQALQELVRWAQRQELALRETVLSPGDFTRVLEEPDTEELRHLVAASNPTDPAIYTTSHSLAGKAAGDD